MCENEGVVRGTEYARAACRFFNKWSTTRKESFDVSFISQVRELQAPCFL